MMGGFLRSEPEVITPTFNRAYGTLDDRILHVQGQISFTTFEYIYIYLFFVIVLFFFKNLHFHVHKTVQKTRHHQHCSYINITDRQLGYRRRLPLKTKVTRPCSFLTLVEIKHNILEIPLCSLSTETQSCRDLFF